MLLGKKKKKNDCVFMEMIALQLQELKIAYIKIYVSILFFIYSINSIIHFFYCSSVFYINFLSMIFF